MKMSNLERQDHTIRLPEKVTFDNVMQLYKDLHKQLNTSKHFVIDLANVTHCDSSLLALLLTVQANAYKFKKEIQFVAIPENLADLARVCHVDGVLDI